MSLGISHLSSGGLITNYYCSSQCKHCLYACSPSWQKDYIDQETVRLNLRKLRKLGCSSVHVGGGEPFLALDKLAMVLDTAREEEMRIEYVETNSSWFKNADQAADVLSGLMSHGLNAILVSISPFHNEHIPLNKVKGVLEACQQTGVQPFPWIMDLFSEIDALDGDACHSLEEFAIQYGDDYITRIPNRYWVTMRGRALQTYRPIYPLRSLDSILEKNRNGCGELADTSHFHLDLYGNYLPGLCSGLSIKRDDLGRELKADKYPLLSLLYSKGINGLYDHAVKEHGYIARAEYLSKCDICFTIRSFLVTEKEYQSHELEPAYYYEQLSRERSVKN